MDAYDLLKKRIMARGASVEERIARDKLRTLEKALIYSYQAETIEKDEVEHRALINNNKLKMDYDDKIISIPYSAGVQVGSIFYWPRVDEHWLVYLRHYSEDAYFRGYARKANYNILWEDEFGVVHSEFAAIRGPVETKIKGEMKSNISYDMPNYTLSIIIPNNEDTKKLKRYSRVSVADKIWEVAAEDSISEPGVIDIQLVENYINKDIDSKILETKSKSVLPKNTDLKTSLSNISRIKAGTSFGLWAIIENNAVRQKELEDCASFSIISGDATISEGKLIVGDSIGNVAVQVKVPKLDYYETYYIETVSEEEAVEKYIILGDGSAKSYGSRKYVVKYFVNGFEQKEVGGTWELKNNERLFVITSATREEIEFEWKLGYFGETKLSYCLGDVVVAEKNVKIEALL